MRRILGIPLVERYLSEKVFRAEVSLYPSFVINLLYAGMKLFFGIRYASVWFGTLAVYYLLLAWMRFSLLLHVRRKGRQQENMVSELKICRLCGMILMLLDWALTGMIVLVVRKNSGFEYPGMMIYAMALYTFYMTITAIINVIKFRRCGRPVISAAKVINLTAALVSMLSLETAMLAQFGADQGAAFRQRMSAATGAGVSILILGMAVTMLVRTTDQIHKEANREENPLLAQRGSDFASQNKEENPLLAQRGSDFASQNRED
ncbi:MAG: hypothetical protein ACI4AD_12445 [Roseburia sp.]